MCKFSRVFTSDYEKKTPNHFALAFLKDPSYLSSKKKAHSILWITILCEEIQDFILFFIWFLKGI